MWSCNVLERFLCFCKGHRALTACASYGADLPNGRVRELYYCLACNNPVWVNRSADLTKHDLTQAWPEQ